MPPPIRVPLGKIPDLRDVEIIEPLITQITRLDNFLSSNPGIRDSIIWEDARGNSSYVNWTVSQKSDLALAFVNVQFPTLSATPNLAYTSSNNGLTIFSVDTAWKYFIAYVAASLRVQIYKHVPWSILSYSSQQLAILFDSKSFFRWDSMIWGYVIEIIQGYVTPGDPKRTRLFLKHNSMIKSDQRSTTVSLLSWCSANMWHFLGHLSLLENQTHWQYDGMPPVEKIISGTTRTEGYQNTSPHNWTAGCWGTTGFLKTVLRTVNIPVALEYRCGHAMPHFLLDDTYLTHGDDPYNWLVKTAHPPIPMDDLLIGKAAFDSWLPTITKTNHTSSCVNVGRTPIDLCIIHLPNYLLYHYGLDNAQGLTHANGSVYTTIFQPGGYAVSDLDALNLWSRMDAKISSLGGWQNIPEYS